ncbi:phage tail tape measure protein [Marinobacter nanhaiticus D15-8W]|uniref:Phage tail tape measure protein n=1 Tax=Marinobacter nanhaiticus D15-8W TaxID=626887 RepID=N6X0J9_9GAMM|nr:phage tail tape measure protein [Marinobacter nanhaiticus]ENO14583.1 phage tail tape measure protein [Marinobacter nanhaiticus D15-8W]BES69732.1 phage tail tape measure protein [Marinobacter nanhaiticus D15-8W]BES69777.1 phage tail tape measure protein [Marinobacter nanhaiticus D15-8W]
MSAALEKLFFSVGMRDQVSGPLGKIDKSLMSVRRSASAGFQEIAGGAVGLAGTGLAIKSMIQPAMEMERAIGEVRSLGVADAELQKLTDTALQFSIQYGKSAKDFVRSSYDIQSAIAGLNNGELATFTESSNLLAAATKADAGTITSYMGTMYGIFSRQADAMGRSEWVQQLTGQTAAAVQMFKTDGQNMSAAFTSLGANARAAGVDLSEQMAILGTLQATMSGSEAGTKYKAFLAGVGNAQKKLGLSFTDSEGRLLPMIQILEELQGKFGDTLNVAESDALKSAFGSDEAVSMVKLLLKDTGRLAGSINDLGKVTGMDKARQMASAMVDPYQQFSAAVDAIRVSFGQVLLPVINPVLESLAEGGATLTRWTQLFPNLTRWVGLGAIGVLGLGAAVSAFALLTGLATLATAGWTGALLAARGVMWMVNAGLVVMRVMAIAGLVTALVGAVGVMGAVRGAMLLWQGAIWLVNAAMWANPLTWIVAGIIALIGAVAAMIYWWNDLKAAFMDSAWGQALMAVIDGIVGWFKELGSIFDWVIEKLETIPGIDFGDSTVPALEQGRQLNVPAGGVAAQAGGGNRSANYGDVYINSSQPMGPAELEEWSMMEAG